MSDRLVVFFFFKKTIVIGSPSDFTFCLWFISFLNPHSPFQELTDKLVGPNMLHSILGTRLGH